LHSSQQNRAKRDYLLNCVKTLNEVYSALWMRRRYEVWFVRIGLADGSGAWWFRYLLMNRGRGGCAGNPSGMPVQVWATWFPRDGKPQSFIQGFPLEGLELSARNQSPFHLCIADNEIGEDFCRGVLAGDGHRISWDLRYRSTFRVTLSNKGWIGFSRSPHSDALFSGKITVDGRSFEGNPLGFGVQGHNCGYKHRNFWTWAHVYFSRPEGQPATTLEAVVYDMPFGLIFRKAVLWHDGKQYEFRRLAEIRREARQFAWNFRSSTRQGMKLEVDIDGSGTCLHRLPYLKTDCKGSFEVLNNSLARATLRLQFPDESVAILETTTGAVLEMAGHLLQAKS
jgi:hypothetical protein